jgi:hypothetical protein
MHKVSVVFLQFLVELLWALCLNFSRQGHKECQFIVRCKSTNKSISKIAIEDLHKKMANNFFFIFEIFI